MHKQLGRGKEASSPCIASAWTPFAGNLAAVLEGLQEDQFLIISVKKSNNYVQFAGQGAHGLRMETTSNHYLDKTDQLTEEQIAMLTNSGWNPPTNCPEEATPEKDPEGSSNFFIDYSLPVPIKNVADLAVKTFSEILRVPYPGYLEYKAFDTDDNSLVYPALGLKSRISPADADPEQIKQRLLATVQEETGIPDIKYDSDGDIAISRGTAVIFICCLDDPPTIRFYSPLVTGVEASPKLLARLNELNMREGFMHYFHHQHRILAATDIPGAPFAVNHVVQTMRRFCEIVDGMDGILAMEFGGQTAVREFLPSTQTH
jgi:hypothetical protein